MQNWQQELAELSVTDRHIRRCRELIDAQERRVRTAKFMRRGTGEPKRLLTALQESVDALALHRTVLNSKSDVLRTGHTRVAFPQRPYPALFAERAAQGTVLLVDDDVNALVALETLISEAGHSVMTASNNKDALEQAHVVVSDMMMPMMDGATLVSALSAAPHVPVSAFLQKPYVPKQLLALIGRLTAQAAKRVRLSQQLARANRAHAKSTTRRWCMRASLSSNRWSWRRRKPQTG
jgi:CheY-like chemotaxis protein